MVPGKNKIGIGDRGRWVNFRQGENQDIYVFVALNGNIEWKYRARKRDMLYLPIFEAIETDERPYIILREITNILEGFITSADLSPSRLQFNQVMYLSQSNLLFLAEGESEARFNNKCCVGCWLGSFE